MTDHFESPGANKPPVFFSFLFTVQDSWPTSTTLLGWGTVPPLLLFSFLLNLEQLFWGLFFRFAGEESFEEGKNKVTAVCAITPVGDRSDVVCGHFRKANALRRSKAKKRRHDVRLEGEIAV